MKNKLNLIIIFLLSIFAFTSCPDAPSGVLPSLTVKYDGNSATGGSVPVDTGFYTEGDEVTVLGNTADLVKTGCSFAGWNTEIGGSGAAYSEDDTFIIGSESVLLYAQWTAVPTYRVSYNSNGADVGGVPVDEQFYAAGTEVSVLGNTGGLERDGYLFTGWETGSGISEAVYYAEDTFIIGAASVELSARWMSPAELTADAVKITPPEPLVLSGSWFGYSVAISGDYAIVGAYRHREDFVLVGAVFIYHKTAENTWDEGTMIIAEEGEADDAFGYSVAISGDYAVAGAYQEDGLFVDTGAVYVYHRTGLNSWDSVTKITAYDAQAYDEFGSSVSISGDYIIVGNPNDDIVPSNSGSAYIYRRTDENAWDDVKKIWPTDSENNNGFGISVSIDSDYAVVGANLDNDNGIRSGSAYVFHRTALNDWDGGVKILASDGAVDDRFGSSVSISGDYAAVGSSLDDDNGTDSGSAYIFHRTGINIWDDGTRLLASDGAAGDGFGSSVAVSGDYAFIGAYMDDDKGADSGSSYLFHRTGVNGWDTGTMVIDSDGADGDNYGCSFAVSGDYAVTGAYKDDELNGDVGSVTIFQYR